MNTEQQNRNRGARPSGLVITHNFGRTNPEGIEINQPRVATKELPWVREDNDFFNPERVATPTQTLRRRFNPFRVVDSCGAHPQGSSQARNRGLKDLNPVGIQMGSAEMWVTTRPEGRAPLCIVLLLGSILALTSAIAPGFASDQTTQVAAGQRLFFKNCAHCHGADARGDEGPDLHNLDLSDQQIATRIRNGKKGQMTAFAGKLSPDQIQEVIAFLRTLK